MGEIVYKDESFKIVGACFEVYKAMGAGFVESVYHECLELEFAIQALPFRTKRELPLAYKGVPLVTKFVPDFVLYDKIILEIKAVRQLTDEHRSQVHNYLKATGFRLGLLVNFGHSPKVESERIVH